MEHAQPNIHSICMDTLQTPFVRRNLNFLNALAFLL